MTAAPVVPQSLERPVARSQARSRIQQLIDTNRSEVERACIQGGSRELVRILAQTEAELATRLRSLRASGRGDTWTAADVEASLVQVRAALAQAEPRMGALLERNAAIGRRLGAESTVDVLRHFERRLGAIRPLAVREALALEHPLLLRYQSSIERYGRQTIGVIRRELQQGVLTGETFDTMTRRLTGERGRAGMLIEKRGWAERIVRTEAMAAYADGAHTEIVAQKQARFKDLKRKLIETFDTRTAPDSYVAHGQVRDVDGLFDDGKHRYLKPPGRPNDRACLIPWREVWGEDLPIEEREVKAPPRVVPTPVVATMAPAAPATTAQIKLPLARSYSNVTAAQLEARARAYATPEAMAAAQTQPAEEVGRAWIKIPTDERGAPRFSQAALDAAIADARAGRLAAPVLVLKDGMLHPATDADAVRAAAHSAVHKDGTTGAQIRAHVIRPAHVTDKQVFAREMSAALEAGDQVSIRGLLRDHIAGKGLRSRDVSGVNELPEAFEFGPLASPDGKGPRATHKWSGKIVVREDILPDVRSAYRKVAAGEKLTYDELRAINTLFHEESHGHSARAKSAYAGYGVAVEEVGTEMLARRMSADLVGFDRSRLKAGAAYAYPRPVTQPDGSLVYQAPDDAKKRSYDGFIGPFLGHVHQAIGGDPETVAERLVDAYTRLRSDHTTTYPTPRAHAEALGRELGLNGARLEAFLTSLEGDVSLRKG